jgi:multiple sugar transport system ATP-binding protein
MGNNLEGMDMGNIKAKNIHKSFGAVHVIKGVDFEIAEGEFVVFVGPSGCGKSTMLRLIAGLDVTSSGTIEIDGEDVTSLDAGDRGLAMVFQTYALYPHMTVRDNMSFGLKMAGKSKQERYAAVDNAADILHLEPLLDRKPGELSGGQRQRVAIGRAIVRNPTAFLFDEPLSNLDAALRVEMRIEIADLQHRLKKTMIYVTHDQVEAMTLADRIIVFKDGIIQQIGRPLDLYDKPYNLFVATFIGSPNMNIMRCKAVSEGVELENGSVIAAKKIGGEVVHVGIRPEHILLVAKEDAELTGEVTSAEHLGGDSYLYVNVAGVASINIRVSGGVDVKKGEPVHMKFTTENLHFFDKAELRIHDS